MKFDGEIMEIRAAYDRTGSFRTAAEPTGGSHHAVARHVAARDAGQPNAEPGYRGRNTNTYLPKVEEWVEKTLLNILGNRAHDELLTLSDEGSERSTRHAVAEVRAACRLGHSRGAPPRG